MNANYEDFKAWALLQGWFSLTDTSYEDTQTAEWVAPSGAKTFVTYYTETGAII